VFKLAVEGAVLISTYNFIHIRDKRLARSLKPGRLCWVPDDR